MQTQKSPHQNFSSNKPPVSRQEEKPPSIVYYLDPEKKILNTELLVKIAEEKAKSLPDGDERLSKSQIRRFFGALKNLHFQLKSNRPWEEIKPLFKMYQSKVAYAERAKNKRIPSEFARFLKENIKQVETKEDFEAFMLYFEAMLGYAYGLNKIGGEK